MKLENVVLQGDIAIALSDITIVSVADALEQLTMGRLTVIVTSGVLAGISSGVVG